MYSKKDITEGKGRIVYERAKKAWALPGGEFTHSESEARYAAAQIDLIHRGKSTLFTRLSR